MNDYCKQDIMIMSIHLYTLMVGSTNKTQHLLLGIDIAGSV